MKKLYLYFSLVLFLVFAHPALAQGGCDDSPENPTLILAGLACGVYAVNSLRFRAQARRSAKKQ
jgi:XrtJ-associated TM-motif-TM protein